VIGDGYKRLHSPVDKHVGARIRMRRMMLGITQMQLGESLGVTFQQVQKYEKGTNRVSASKLQSIASILQAPVAFFFEGAPNGPRGQTSQSGAPSPPFITEFLATRDGLALVRAFTQIKSPKLRRRIVDLVEEISK
jgi:transcriptional regulator with XRE-family HTH domain